MVRMSAHSSATPSRPTTRSGIQSSRLNGITPKPPLPPRSHLTSKKVGPGLAVNFKAGYPPPNGNLGRRTKQGSNLAYAFAELVKTRGSILRSSDFCEQQFLTFVQKIKTERVYWLNCKRERDNLAAQLNQKDKELFAKDYKIKQARRMLEDESRLRQAAEQDRDEATKQLNMMRDILLSSTDNGQKLDHATLERVKRVQIKTSATSLGRHNNMTDRDEVPHYGEESMESVLDVSDLMFDDSRDICESTRRQSADAKSGGRYRRRSSGRLQIAEKRRQSRCHAIAAGNRSRDQLDVRHGYDNDIVLPEWTEQAETVLSGGRQHFRQAARKSRERRSDKFAAIRIMAHQDADGLTDIQVEALPTENGGLVSDKTPRESRHRDQPSSSPRIGGKISSYFSRAKIDGEAVHSPGIDATEQVPQVHVSPPSYGKGLFGDSKFGRSSIPNRAHCFQERKLLSSLQCCVCKGRISFQRMHNKCRECQISCHVECRPSISVPCINLSSAKMASAHGKRSASSRFGATDSTLALAEIVSTDLPLVPPVLLYCIREVEHRGLDQVGIYRIPGNEGETVDLLDKMYRYMTGKGNLPSLVKYDIHIVTSVIKRLLRSLREPIISADRRQMFIDLCTPKSKHAKACTASDLMAAVEQDLPRANRDTLAQLMLHLQIVADSPLCKMPDSNLAAVMGPTLVGYASKVGEMLAETQLQQNVVLAMLQLPPAYWAALLADGVPGRAMVFSDGGKCTPPAREHDDAAQNVPASCIAKHTRSRSRTDTLDMFQSPMLLS